MNNIKRSILPSILIGLLFILGIQGVSYADTSSNACATDATVVKYDYLGACGLTRTSTFTLSEAANVSRIRVWYNTNVGTNTLNATIKGSNGASSYSWSGQTVKGGCDTYQKNWCEGIITLNQLLPAGNYSVDIGSTSMCSNPSGQTTLIVYGCASKLDAPSDFRYTLAAGDNVTMNWNPSSGAEGYRLLWGTTAPGNHPTVIELGNRTQLGPLDVSGFPRGNYYLAVEAYNKSSNSSASNEIVIKLGDTSTALLPPVNVQPALNDNLFTLKWSPVANASGYNVYYGNSKGQYPGFINVGNATQFGAIDVSSLPRGTYYLAVTAYDAKRQSAYSSEVSVTLTSGDVPDGNINSYVDLVMNLSNDTLNGGLTDQLQPILSAVLGKPTSTCPAVTTNFSTSSASSLDAFLQNLPKPATANVNYGNGCVAEKGETMAGQASLKLDNLDINATTKSIIANFSMQMSNLTKNNKVIGDGTIAGNLNANLNNSTVDGHLDLTQFLVSNGLSLSGGVDIQVLSNADLSLAMDIATSNAINAKLTLLATKIDADNYSLSTKTPGSVNQYTVNVNSVLYNNTLCKAYPIGGSVSFSAAGKTQQVQFNNRCDGKYTVG
ncbi:MAG: fibronectin type III domain-containing protein [Methylococcaceae bacterium]